MTKGNWISAAVVAAVLVVGVGAWLFQPWRILTSSTVDEAVPTATSGADQTESATPVDKPTTTPTDRELGAGTFVDAEHATAGAVRLLELADGRRFVRIEGLASSDGPDLHVWLSDRPSGGDWGSYDDGRYVALGGLKATHGNQNYEIPAGADLAGLKSVVIWCDRFNIAFGTAPISAA
ncbi:secreted protein [Nocardioides sp. CF8]|uniref:DM13 domain-containing protein n=1 Tax=Nocardioides sp. CF8 TaxID=110319 RepID=UPI00032E8C71|nr:DM13 domain-containing protein [Nocardioides sp. CF8]EON23575.1 secreted protein [Nocardioides sp. CF8]